MLTRHRFSSYVVFILHTGSETISLHLVFRLWPLTVPGTFEVKGYVMGTVARRCSGDYLRIYVRNVKLTPRKPLMHIESPFTVSSTVYTRQLDWRNSLLRIKFLFTL